MHKTFKIFLVIAFILSLFSFNTTFAQADREPPRVVATYPGSNASTGSRVSITFSEPMDPGSMSTNYIQVQESLGDPVSGEVIYGNSTVTFIPFTTLSENSTYNVTVSGDVRDKAGNTLGSDYKWSFSTRMGQ